jgi:hypothetical protein
MCGMFIWWGFFVFSVFTAHQAQIGGSALWDLSRHDAVLSHGHYFPVTREQWDTSFYIGIAFLISFPPGFVAGMIYVVKAVLPDLGYKPFA